MSHFSCALLTLFLFFFLSVVVVALFSFFLPFALFTEGKRYMSMCNRIKIIFARACELVSASRWLSFLRNSICSREEGNEKPTHMQQNEKKNDAVEAHNFSESSMTLVLELHWRSEWPNISRMECVVVRNGNVRTNEKEETLWNGLRYISAVKFEGNKVQSSPYISFVEIANAGCEWFVRFLSRSILWNSLCLELQQSDYQSVSKASKMRAEPGTLVFLALLAHYCMFT